jgi:hypothetical protein
MSTAIHTTKVAAERLGVTDRRIRQLCVEYAIQRQGRDWMIRDSTLRMFSQKIRKKVSDSA